MNLSPTSQFSTRSPPLKPGPMPEKPTTEPVEVDRKFMDLYSRQIGTYGMDTMVRLITLKVAVLGLGGAGAEAAKNLALAGVHTLALFDSTPASERDQGTNFCITQSHIKSGATRASATHDLVSQLNPNTRVKVLGDADSSTLSEFDCVVATTAHSPCTLEEVERINGVCRARRPSGSFIFCFSGGSLGSIFVDHGKGFVTKDPDGRPSLQKSITEVVTRTDKSGTEYTRLRLAVPEGMNPGALRDITEVTFSDVKGWIHSETGQSICDVKTPFKGLHGLGDPANTIRLYPSLQAQGYSEYQGGGFVHEAKEVTIRDFRDFHECLTVPPEVIITDSMFTGTAEKNVHMAMASILTYASAHGRFPGYDEDDAASEVVKNAHAIQARGEEALKSWSADAPASTEPQSNPEFPSPLPPPPPPVPFTADDVDEGFLRKASKTCTLELQPLATLLGAIVAQEVVKITGKFTPIYQSLHLNFASVLPDESADKLRGDRYDDLRGLFGQAFVEKLGNLNMFMVGCGALGCEYIKNFALCGICCGPQGRLTVTDNDRIEVSNLNRQFLFREDNVGQQKSVAAGNRAKVMNSDLKIDPRTDFMGDSTEHLFTDEFWMQLDVVTNALDNMAARLYVDDKCALFEKVLVEAGTMGTAGNVDIVVPHKTTTYAAGGAADETGGIPMCTLRNFPYIFDHCIEWARAQFEDLFVSPIMMTQQLRENPEAFKHKTRAEVENQDNIGLRRSMLAKNLKTLQQLLKVATVLSAETITIDVCVELAWNAFHAQFRDRIVSLVTAFPADAKKRNGDPFWSGHRKFPAVLDANLDDDDVRDFLIAATNLFACMLGVHGEKHPPVKNDPNKRWMSQYRTNEWIWDAISKHPVPPVQASAVDDLDDETSGSAAQDISDEDQERQFADLLNAVAELGGRLSGNAVPLDFEKDDDDNFHIDFVAAASNLRARNYQIAPKDRMAVKLVAGKIIPAIATTTAAVTGIALMELFKVLQGKEVSSLRNGMLDLGSNNYTMFDRDPPAKVKSYVKKTYYPEQDYTDEQPIVAFPNPHTTYDKLVVDVDSSTTISDFVSQLQKMSEDAAEEAPYEVVALGVGKASLWNGLPSHSNFGKPLLACIASALGQEATFWKGRRLYHRLAVNLETAEGNEVEPATIVLSMKE